MLRSLSVRPLRVLSPARPIQRRLLASSTSQSPPPARKPSAIISQQAAKEWKELSTPQKVVAASKATVNIGVIVTGVVVTGALVYFVTSELFGSQSSTSIFSDAVDRVRKNEELVEMLGEPIKGHGEPSRNRMKRNRRIRYQIVNDQQDQPHLFMRFYVEGPNNEGTGMVEMIKDEKDKWQYKQLFVDVPGQGLPSRRIYLEHHS
ncbi:mitochondrial import inner membrane translocase subunit tim21 [Apophysomyces sp. BC1034]|nr:mitochondrial import inner membrane translocase subunit tim21 [Apophysomyces sp. BC1021]KAG0192722.1 mitochondrial import inner membrane translocase subunit tim21 [Apophysomyces sp. BC1034]